MNNHLIAIVIKRANKIIFATRSIYTEAQRNFFDPKNEHGAFKKVIIFRNTFCHQ